MRIVTFASGSTGNCSLITEGRTNILIDAGISMRRTLAALETLGLTPRDLCGVLITHEHSDHISGLPMLVKHYGVKVFAPKALCGVLAGMKPQITNNLNCMPEDDKAELGGIAVSCFRTPHDAAYSVGYRFEGENIIAYATDTGSISDELVRGLEGAELALIEANHDVEMLKTGPYPYYLKQRIISPRGHLSNNDSGKLALHLAKSGTRHIILGHLSRENNTPELAYNTVNDAVSTETAEISVAPMNNLLAVTVGERVKCLV